MNWFSHIPKMRVPRWLWVLLPVLVFALPVTWKLSVPACTYHMEVLTQLSSQEVWLRFHDGDRGAWLTPTLHGKARIRKPPGAAWLHGAVWRGLTPANSDVQARAARARHLAAASVLLMLVGTGLLGRAAAGPRVGWMAALLLASTMTVLRQARLASYDTYLMALAGLALGLAFMALNKARQQRWALAVTLAALGGVVLGMSVFVKNAVALLFVLLSLLGAALVDRRCRRPALIVGLLLTVVAAGLVAPWYLHALRTGPDAQSQLLSETLSPGRAQPPWYYIVFIAMLVPWSVSFVGALVAPRSRGLRLRGLWVGLVLVLVVLSCAISKRQRYVLPALPLAAVLIADFWNRLARGAMVRRLSKRFLAIFLGLHAWPLVLASAALVPVAVVERLMKSGDGTRDMMVGPPLAMLPVAALLLLLALGVLRSMRVARFRQAFVMTALWMALAFAAITNSYVYTSHGRNPFSDAGAFLKSHFTGQRLATLYREGDASSLLDGRIELYAERVISSHSMRSVTNDATLLREADLVIVPKIPKRPAPADMGCQGDAPIATFMQEGTLFEVWPVSHPDR
jgi:4-amino-4-deoxy-L-arabinose transferase-like glycosyltransferase